MSILTISSLYVRSLKTCQTCSRPCQQLDIIKESVPHAAKKNCLNYDCDPDNSVLALHDYNNATAASYMIDIVVGLHIFPRTDFGYDHDNGILDSMCVVLDIKKPSDKVFYLNCHVVRGCSQYKLSTYLDRASERLHDAILPKIFSVFFAALRSNNPL